MTVTKRIAVNIINNLLNTQEFSINAWEGKKFKRVKILSPGDKGMLGEELLHQLLGRMNYSPETQKGRRGHWDVKVENGGEPCTFEVKVATEDTNGSHQFNGIRRDTKYSHLFLLGIRYDELLYLIIAKKELDDYPLVPMQKGTNSTFKLQRKAEDLKSFDSFGAEISSLLGKPVKP